MIRTAAGLLLATMVTASSATAEAQINLVGNWANPWLAEGESSAQLNDTIRAIGLPFRTGSDRGGYKIDSISVQLGSISGTIKAGGVVYEQQENGTAPNESKEVLALFRIGALKQHARNTWTPSLFNFNRFLRPNADYVFVLECANRCAGPNTAKLRLTSSADEDATSQAGWSLGNRVQQNFIGYWQTYPQRHSLVMDIKGEFARRPYIKDVRITSVPKATATGDTYADGEPIKLTVRYSEPMLVTGTPGFQFDLGGATRTAWYVGGATTGGLRFAYTVASGDIDRNGISIGSSEETWTNVDGMKSLATGNSAQLDHDALGTQTGHKVDADIDRPVVTAVTLSSTPLVGTTYGRGETIELKTMFDRALSVSGTPQARIAVGSAMRRASYAGGSGTDTLAFEYVVQQGDVDGNGISIPKDALISDERANGPNQTLIWDTATTAVANTASAAITDAAGHRVNGALLRQGQSTLRRLDVEGVNLTPTFEPNEHQYTATTATGAEVTVDARPGVAAATVDIDPDDADSNQAGHQVPLIGGGTRTITITVTAIDGSQTDYTIDFAHSGVVPARMDEPILRTGTDRESKIEVRWTPPSDHGNPITRYDARAREVGTASWSEQSVGSTARSMTFVNLKADGHYEVQVRAANFVGPGLWSTSATAQVAAPPPDAPEAPTVAAASRGALKVSWIAPPDHGRDIKDYNVQFRVAGETNWHLSEQTIGPRTAMTLTGLRSGTVYDAQVRAISLSGRSPWSPTGSGETATEPCSERFDDDWCTTLTVAARTTSGGTQTGARPNDFGAIANTAIVHAGTTYTVQGIWLWQGNGNTGTVNVEFQGTEPPHGSTFNLGGWTFVTGPNSEHPTVANRHRWDWPTGLEWHNRQKVTVSARVQRGNDDATLRRLSLSTGDGYLIAFNPAFDPATDTYTADVAHTVDTMTVEPTTAYFRAEVEYLDADSKPTADAEAGEPSFQYPLSKGENRLGIRVTAGDASTTRTYTITVTRSDAAAIAPGNEEGTPGALRLVDDEGEVQYGSETAAGRLEFFHARRWGTVCRDRFRTTYSNADPLPGTNIVPRNFAPALACKQLGYANGEYASGWGQPGLAHKRPGPNDAYTKWQPIWLDDVRCSVGSTHRTGDYPDRIDQCHFSGLNAKTHNCTHADDAGIRCFGGRTPTTLASHSDGVEHDGSAPASINLAFHVREGDPIGTSEQDFTDHAMIAQGTASVRATRNSTDANSWTLILTPSGYDDMRVVIPAYRDCHEPGAICTGSRNPLSETIVIDVPYGESSTQMLALTGEFQGIPASHDGSTPFTIRLSLSTSIENTGAVLRDHAIQVDGGTITAVTPVNGRRDLWDFTAAPSSRAALTLRINAGGTCGEPTTLCTSGGDTLSETISATVEGPAGVAPLTARFENGPGTHDGTSAFNVYLRFSEAPANVKNIHIKGALQITGGKILRVRVVGGAGGDGAHRRVEIEPSGDGDMRLSLFPTTDCGAANALCTADGQKLESLITLTTRGPTSAPPPITATFENVPEEHQGKTRLDLNVRFSEPPTGGKNAVAASLTMVRAAKWGVKGLDTTGHLYRSALRPHDFRPITVTLRATADCAAAGALCTAGGARLEEGISVTIPGPVAIRVADASVEEAAGAVLAFAVTLDRARHNTVTVDYATVNGTATAGEDYTAASGTLTFAAGETAKTVEVAVLDDLHDEGNETMVFKLSNATGARIADGEGIGTIENTDLMPQAWLARFGRTVAEQVIDAVETRMSGPRNPGGEVSLAGQRLGLGPLFGADAAPEGEAALAKRARETEAEAEEGQRRLAAWLRGAAEEEERPGLETRTVTQRELLLGSSFSLTAASGDGAPDAVSLWGRAAVSRFDGREDGLTLDGEVASGLLGADWARERSTLGLIVSHSRGDGGYRGEAGSGTVSSTLTGLYPWGRHALNGRVTVWGVAGYGAGTLTLTPEGPDGESRAAMRTDMDLMMGAVGLRGLVVQAPADGGLELAVKTDAMGVRTASAKARGLAASEAEVTRLRLGLEGSRAVRFGDGAVLTPRLELGARHDGGDAETGFGLDVGGGLAWSDRGRGISAELRGRALVSHESRGFRDVGLSGAFGWEPVSGGRGPRLTLSQSAGASSSGGVSALLERGTLEGLAANGNGAGSGEELLANRRFEMRLGYGFAAFGERFTSMPEFGFGTSEGRRDYSLGWRLARAARFGGALELALEAQRQEAANDDAAPEHGIGLRFTARW